MECRDGGEGPAPVVAVLLAFAKHGGEEEWIVPVAAVARITLRVAEEEEPFGFTLPET
jgi:hypothetical protein